jgi:serine/threonine protein kinase
MGARLGRYLVLKHLASGGMADVLLGRSEGIEGFERHVVLKRIRPEHARDQRFIRMFLDEARVAANLHHQHIVQVHDVGESAGEYFIAMEYLHGEDVRTILATASGARQHVPLGHAIAIVSAAAAGLHYAHERRGPDRRPLGIVHRDVSPSNILVGYDGSVKIVDFGIAKIAMREETRSGGLKGKVSYMSPEQCKCAEIDRRSDVYALGVVLYELCTMTRLFQGDNDYLVMDQIVNGRVPLPRVRRPDLPNELSVIIMRAIATDPDRRYATADELRLVLDQYANHFKLTAPTSSIAAYMRKQFGEKPEPWLDLGEPLVEALPGGKLATGTSRPGLSWTPLGGTEQSGGEARVRGSATVPRPSGSVGGHAVPSGLAGRLAPAGRVMAAIPGTGIGTGTGGLAEDPVPPGTWRTIMRRPTRPPPTSLPPTSLPPAQAAPTQTRPTDSRMGWESQRPAAPRSFTPARLATLAVPLVAIAGGALWWFAGGGVEVPAAEVTAPQAMPAVAATPPRVTPAPAPDNAVASPPAELAAADSRRSASERSKRSTAPVSRKPSSAKSIELAAPGHGNTAAASASPPAASSPMLASSQALPSPAAAPPAPAPPTPATQHRAPRPLPHRQGRCSCRAPCSTGPPRRTGASSRRATAATTCTERSRSGSPSMPRAT